MIDTPRKRYQISLWVVSREDPSDPGLHLEFDTLEEAQAAFEAQRRAGVYRSGLLLDWRKDWSTWLYLDGYSID